MTRSRPAFLLVVLLLAAAAGDGLSATSPSTPPTPPAPCSALEFRLGGDFSLDPFRGSTVSWKRHAAADHGWRLGLSPSFERERTGDGVHDESRTDRLGLDLEWQYLGYLDSRSLARPYWAAGLLVGGMRHESSLIHRNSGDLFDALREVTVTDYRAGLTAALGAEFTIAQKVTIGAEYGLEATWTRRRHITKEQDIETGLMRDRRFTETLIRLQSRSAALTVAILF